MTAVPNEVARRRPANAPVRPESQVIEGQARRIHSKGDAKTRTVLLWFAYVLLSALVAGYLLSGLNVL